MSHDQMQADRLLLQRVPQKWAVGILLSAALFITAGCGGKEGGVSVYPVRGKVTHNGLPAAGARVSLYATSQIDDKTPIPTAVAKADGTFEVTSYEPGDGAPAGEYTATVVWFDPPPPGVNPESHSPTDKLGSRYATPEKSPLRVTVTEGDNEVEPFALK